ncbi:MAG: T9SS type A sorting domain-containing protein [Flavobacteriales bacterium]|nr:T9SS type A sorting domain-containing protein [Flavobacteriales bacterium]
MNRYYASAFFFVLASTGTVMAQTRTAQGRALIPVKPTLDETVPIGPAAMGERSTVIWEDDFSTPSNWTLGYDGTLALNWQVGVGLTNTGDYPTQPVNSPSQGNGYAMLDSDGFNNNTGLIEQSHMTTANPINTTGYDNVILEFQTFYRKWTNEEIYIVVSTNNTDWIPLEPSSTDVTPIPGVYEVFPGMEVQAVISNPTRVRINISDAAGNQPQVWIRFYWSGEWGYSWFVDDVKVLEQPAYELVMEDGFLSHTGNGEEYGRVPQQHLNPTMRVGGSVLNFGVNAMTNCQVQMNVNGPSGFSAIGNSVNLASAESATMDQSVNLPNGGALAGGLYQGNFTVVADEDDQEDDLGNNTYLRNFEVNPDWYSVDGIGNHPTGYQTLSSLGTNSFTGDSDGIILLNQYPIRTAQTVHGLEFLITSTSQENSYVICSIYDTTVTATFDLLPPLYETDVIDITAADVTAGRVVVPFDSPQLLQPNAYYIGVKLFSNGGVNNLRIVDDLTVPQPALTSAIYLPSDSRIYSNGNGFAIRMATTTLVSVPEAGELAGISIYPNPALDGLVQFRSATPGAFTIQVLDVLGQEVLNTRSNGSSTLDLSGHAKGAYLVRVSDGNASTVQRVMVD